MHQVMGFARWLGMGAWLVGREGQAGLKGLLAFFLTMFGSATLACTIVFSAPPAGDTEYELQGTELASCNPSFAFFYEDQDAIDWPVYVGVGGSSHIAIEDLTGYNPGTPSASVYTITYHGDGTGGGSTRSATVYTYDAEFNLPLQAHTIQVNVLAAPTVTGLSPTSGSPAGNTTVTITGTGFTGATGVQFDGTSATNFTVVNATTITATSPAHAAGTVHVTVFNGLTSAAGSASQFTYVTPVVAGPASATVAYGSLNNPITLNLSGGAATSVAVGTGATHGDATASGTTITYTPYASYAGPDSFTYTASNGAGTSAPATVTITVSPPNITYAPSNPAAGAVGAAYSQSVAGASGGTGPYTYAKESGNLPAGITLAANGTLSGTPTASGTFNFTVKATDSSVGTGPFSHTSGTLSLSINAPTMSLTPASMNNATVASAYNQTITASGGTSPYSYATEGALPAGLSLSPGGEISGTPTAGGTFNFTVSATDSSTGTGPYVVSVGYALTVNAPTITVAPASLSAISAGATVSGTLTASGGTGPYTYSVPPGSLPPGVSLSSGGGLSGKATATGTYSFTVTAKDSSAGSGPYSGSRNYSWTVNAPSLAISPASGALPSGTALAPYSQTFTTSGGTAPYTYDLEVTSGAMPTGLSFSPSTGVLSGTPTTDGTVSFTVRATDATTGAGSPFSVIGTYSLTVGAPTITVAPTTLPNAVAGAAYSQTLTASGGSTRYSYALSAGALPPGLSLSAGGMLSGTPRAAGSFNITVTATDANNFTGTRAYLNTIAAPTIAVAPATLPSGNVNVAYSQTVSGSGGTLPYAYARTAGAFPPGLSLNPDTGAIAGTPSATGTYNFTVTATDSTTGTGAPFSTGQAYSVAIGVEPPGAGAKTVNTAFNTAVLIDLAPAITGGTPASIALASPPAHGLATVSGLKVNYTPTTGYVGTDTLTYTATNTGGTSTPATVTVTVDPPVISVAPANLPGGSTSAPYSQTVTGGGGTAPYSYAVTAGALPTGLTLDSATGAITGTPTVANTYGFTVTATDSTTGPGAPFTGAKAYTVVVQSANAHLSALGLSSGTLTPVFAAETDTFTAAVDHGVTSITVTPAVADANATVTVNGSLVSSGSVSGPINLSVGDNAIVVQVTAQDGTTKDYSVMVKRAPLQSVAGPDATLGIANPGAACALTATSFTAVAQLPVQPPAGYTYPYAAMGFTAKGCASNSDLTVTLTFPATVPTNAVLMKYDATANPPWQAFTPDAINGNQVSYTVHDGGPLDADKTVNGEFVDPVLLALPVPAPPPVSIPALSHGALALLAFVLGAFGWRVRRRA